MSLRAWLQERQYATPYHWHQAGNDELEYQLRTHVVLELAGLDGANGRRPRLLDVGCGDARFTSDAAARASVVGVDRSARALAFARKLVPAARFSVSGAEALPFASESFDIVTLLDVIEHIPDGDEPRVVAEARRVLRRGGRLVVSTNTDRSAREPKHFRHYPIPRFASLFDGLADVRLAGLIPYFPTLKIWLSLPITGRLLRSRVRRCPPDRAHVVVGVGSKR